MADIVLASLLLVGGLAWCFVCLMAYASHPTPSRADFGGIVYLGPIAAVAGAVWWIWLIVGWVL